MDDALEIASKAAVLVFVVSCMLTAGLGLNVGEILAPLQRVKLVIFAVLANFVVAPGIALALTRIVPLDSSYECGLLLLGGAAGAPFLPKLAELANGDIAFSVGLMILLMVGSVVFMPLALPLMIPGLSAEPWPILKPLLVTMLLPLAAGMVIRSRLTHWSLTLRAVVGRISNISMLAAIILLIGINYQSLMGTFGTGAVAVGVTFVVLTFAAGYLLGGPALTTRTVLGLGTGQRNVAAALLIATQNFTEPGVVVMLLATTLAGAAALVLAARRMRR